MGLGAGDAEVVVVVVDTPLLRTRHEVLTTTRVAAQDAMVMFCVAVVLLSSNQLGKEGGFFLLDTVVV